jgi:hypothetical protein
MKWATKQVPSFYDYREVEKFAWLPTKCISQNQYCSYTEYLVWLEYYIDFQQYKRVTDDDSVGEWVSMSNNIIPRNKVK